MIYLLIVLDFLFYTFSAYELYLIVLGIPLLKSFTPLLVYFLILSFFDVRYLFNLFLLYTLYRLNEYIDRSYQNTALIYLAKVLFYTLFYVSLSKAFSAIVS